MSAHTVMEKDEIVKFMRHIYIHRLPMANIVICALLTEVESHVTCCYRLVFYYTYLEYIGPSIHISIHLQRTVQQTARHLARASSNVTLRFDAGSGVNAA